MLRTRGNRRTEPSSIRAPEAYSGEARSTLARLRRSWCTNRRARTSLRLPGKSGRRPRIRPQRFRLVRRSTRPYRRCQGSRADPGRRTARSKVRSPSIGCRPSRPRRCSSVDHRGRNSRTDLPRMLRPSGGRVTPRLCTPKLLRWRRSIRYCKVGPGRCSRLRPDRRNGYSGAPDTRRGPNCTKGFRRTTGSTTRPIPRKGCTCPADSFRLHILRGRSTAALRSRTRPRRPLHHPPPRPKHSWKMASMRRRDCGQSNDRRTLGPERPRITRTRLASRAASLAKGTPDLPIAHGSPLASPAAARKTRLAAGLAESVGQLQRIRTGGFEAVRERGGAVSKSREVHGRRCAAWLPEAAAGSAGAIRATCTGHSWARFSDGDALVRTVQSGHHATAARANSFRTARLTRAAARRGAVPIDRAREVGRTAGLAAGLALATAIRARSRRAQSVRCRAHRAVGDTNRGPVGGGCAAAARAGWTALATTRLARRSAVTADLLRRFAFHARSRARDDRWGSRRRRTTRLAQRTASHASLVVQSVLAGVAARPARTSIARLADAAACRA